MVEENKDLIDKKRLKQALFDKKYLSKKSLSEVLGIPIKTIADWVYRRKIPYHKLGKHIRFDPVDIEQWLQKRRIAS